MKSKPTRGRRRIHLLHDLANDVALLHSNGQLRTESDGDRERIHVTNLLYRRILMTMMT